VTANDPRKQNEPGDAGRLYFDDLAVGLRSRTGEYPVSAAQIKAFAREFDPQPFHLDEAAARASVLGGLAASGWHTAAITMRLIVDSDFKLAAGVVGLGAEVNWPHPTRAGDVLHVESEVIELTPSRSRPDRGVVKIRNETLNERNEVVQVLIAKLLVPRRAARPDLPPSSSA
jgi:acyl dehydratase